MNAIQMVGGAASIALVSASAGFHIREAQEHTGTKKIGLNTMGGIMAGTAALGATSAMLSFSSRLPPGYATGMLAALGVSAAVTAGVMGSALLGRAAADRV